MWTGIWAEKRESGFTLLGLLSAVVILGILAGIAIPSYQSWLPKSRVSGAAREFFSDLQLARMSAISENNNYVITFDTGNNRYSIYDDNDNDFDTSGVESGELLKTVDIDDRYQGIGYGYIAGNNPSGNPITGEVTFTGTPPSVTFKSTGLSNKAGSVYLIPTTDTSRKDRQRAITVSIIGRVRLYRHTGTGSVWE
jgi:type IV fimbrial biogenesis protein FimT